MMKKKKNNIGVIRGKKINTNKIIFIFIIILTLLVILPSCTKVTYMDEEKCAEVALEYMEEKYGKEFEVISSKQPKGVVGRSDYVEVSVKEKITNNEEVFYITLYTDGKKDKDKDGYYDNYKVISDTYMCYLLYPCLKNDIEEILEEIFNKKYMYSFGIEEKELGVGASGFSSEFSVGNLEIFSLKEICDNYNISSSWYIKIPKSVYEEGVKEILEASIKTMLSDDYVMITIEIYSDEKYMQLEEKIKEDKNYDIAGEEVVFFSIKGE